MNVTIIEEQSFIMVFRLWRANSKLSGDAQFE